MNTYELFYKMIALDKTMWAEAQWTLDPLDRRILVHGIDFALGNPTTNLASLLQGAALPQYTQDEPE